MDMKNDIARKAMQFLSPSNNNIFFL